MPKLIMLKGLPASMKTTWAKEQVDKTGCVRISKDDLRLAIGKWSGRKEKLVLKMQEQLIRTCLAEGRTVIIDDTNLNPVHERRFRELARELGIAFEINDSFLEASPEECIERDLRRGEKAVGADVIWEQYYKYVNPLPKNYLVRNKHKPRCVIFDIDGTLALNDEGRSFYDLSRVGEDSVDPLMACVADALYNYGTEADGSPYPKIIIVSGREETCRRETEKWLHRNMIPYDELYMRPAGDFRKDAVIKAEIFHEYIEPYYAVLGVFDDRNRVCREWRKLGLRVCQVGNPDINF